MSDNIYIFGLVGNALFQKVHKEISNEYGM